MRYALKVFQCTIAKAPIAQCSEKFGCRFRVRDYLPKLSMESDTAVWSVERWVFKEPLRSRMRSTLHKSTWFWANTTGYATQSNEKENTPRFLCKSCQMTLLNVVPPRLESWTCRNPSMAESFEICTLNSLSHVHLSLHKAAQVFNMLTKPY